MQGILNAVRPAAAKELQNTTVFSESKHSWVSPQFTAIMHIKKGDKIYVKESDRTNAAGNV